MYVEPHRFLQRPRLRALHRSFGLCQPCPYPVTSKTCRQWESYFALRAQSASLHVSPHHDQLTAVMSTWGIARHGEGASPNANLQEGALKEVEGGLSRTYQCP